MKKYLSNSKVLLWLVAGWSILTFPQVSLAQTAQDVFSLGIAENIVVTGQNIEEGSVITLFDGQYQLSTEKYDTNVFGVVNQTPAVEFTYTDDTLLENTTPVISKGTAIVRVAAQNGAIEVGDRLTTSETPGVAMIANKSGYTIGVAQEAYNPTDANAEGLIIATLDIRYTLSGSNQESSKVQAQLRDVFNLSAIAALEDPTDVFKYVLAAFILVGSIAFSFLVFGRSAQNSILALGRNPLASRAISMGMLLNIMMSIIVIVSGVATAWFVINL